MNREEAKKMLKAKLECLKRETSGTDFDCNNRNCDECPLCYEQGNMGEQKEALGMAIKALEQQPCEETISRQAAIDALMAILDRPNHAEFLYTDEICKALGQLPSARPEVKEIGYAECANAMLKMWIDNVLTDGEYNRIMDKLNTHHDAESEDKDE